MLLRESMGIGADSSDKAFNGNDVTALFKREPVAIFRDPMEYNDRDNTNHIFLACDPAGGGLSAFALCSIVQQPNGGLVVRVKIPRLALLCARTRTSTHPTPGAASCPAARRATSRTRRGTPSRTPRGSGTSGP